MAYKISLRLAGGMFSVSVTAKQAVEKEDKDTKLITLCCGTGQLDLATGVVNTHAPVPPKQAVTCPVCGRQQASFHGWDKGRDNEDSTYTVVPAEVIESARPGENLTKLIDLTLHDLDKVEAETLPSGRVYYLEPGKDASATYNAVVSAVLRLAAEKRRCFVTRYAVVSAVSQYRLIVIDGVLAFQELAIGSQIRLRPQITFPEAVAAQVDLLMMAAELTFSDYDAVNYENDQQRIVAEFLAAASPTTAGDGATPVVAAPKAADPFAALAALLAGGDKVPMQALPAEVPANVSTALLDEKPAAKKRAPRKKAPEKVSA